jgi:hypothetical protein
MVSRRPPYPFSYDGGAERSLAWVGGALRRAGHQIRVCGSCVEPTLTRAIESCSAAGCSCTCGGDGSVEGEYDGMQLRMVPRSAFKRAVREELDAGWPDVIVTQLEGSGIVIPLATSRRIPVILRLVGPGTPETYPSLGPEAFAVANSPLTAQMGMARYGRRIGFIITPIETQVPRAGPPQARFVTFVNPRRNKGLHLFARVAAMRPRLPFLVVMGWRSHPFDDDELQALAYLRQTPNVIFHSGSAQMSEDVFLQTRVLLVPSHWPESWPRVVGEAHAHGIPVLGSGAGCVPHAVGNGGVTLSCADPELWCCVLDRVYGDEALHSELRCAALQNVTRFPKIKATVRWQGAVEAAYRRELWLGGEATASVSILRAVFDDCGHVRIVRDRIGLCDPIDLTQVDPAPARWTSLPSVVQL